ncbi:UDP-N-acetylmuramoyl-tripeptide--D-alanyl-D-alanine ligase [Blattabacterium cuenoti]|uniref:UDP-N-acetylmuramoyl-tripeptide--D-alanyl-D- alanine ligase n=1 Tax=Blattabacterium cuenoti TaxID=1653831 RepID=UPI00163BF85C|nr:UDP-N-acetylmuramoyl-tripeptide--D-alanyl-D-alanine ligase [Blattabacterium cuenoti]
MDFKKIYEIYSIISTGIVTNSKKARKGSIFIAFKGKKLDGNKFVSEAILNGAILAIMDNKKYFSTSCNKMILVNNTLHFLQKLAIYHRYKNNHIPIIAIVGSNGKTTTKELLHKIFAKKYKNVHSTKKNYNNHIGVPLTILSMPKKTQISVIEIGANHEKEIEKMCRIVNPDYGYITNFGKAHLEGFHDFIGIIRSKLELYKYLENSNKLAFVNGDDTIQLSNCINLKKFIFSSEKININPDVKFKYLWNYKGLKSVLLIGNTKIISPLIGDYNLYNMAASVTIGIYFKISINIIKKAIEEYIPKNYRSQIFEKKDKKIIVDCYNANPTSMIKALRFFNNNIEGRKAIILGDMLELGRFSNEEHEKIISFVEKSNIEIAFLIGNNFFYTKKNYTKIKKFLNVKMFADCVLKHPIKSVDFILIKGSRKIKLEKIIYLI